MLLDPMLLLDSKSTHGWLIVPITNFDWNAIYAHQRAEARIMEEGGGGQRGLDPFYDSTDQSIVRQDCCGSQG